MKLRNGETKYILKKALAGLVPESILYRRKKGFGIPLAKWLRDIPAAEYSSSMELPFVNSQKLKSMWTQHQNQRVDYRHALWCSMTLQDRFD